ncbi:sulfite exporter TauE/SafE family protein [Streptomyces sp. LaPpAH-108]|uniref:sulfite exporter TauE/SafE family protein n=1 Tax=Streptomyces sp. LaPpAH-108 TaxID=1155714 RepID=UPI000477BFC8|nr:sulfite exporter TauE/SafE family protein [Streptomyces sp. LaPpAH-108]
MNMMTLWHISGWEFAALALAALLVGFSKTAVSGANTVSLAVFAAVLPARASTGVLLPLLIAGDILAVLTYRRHAHWPTLWRLFPAVGVGVVAGTLFLVRAGDGIVRTSIGAILLLMTGITLWRRRAAARPEPEGAADGGVGAGAPADGWARANGPVADGAAVATRAGRTTAGAYGVLGGFTTMVANAGGPVMSMYLLSAGFRKLGFLGTSAFFFLIVNVSKVPFSAALGLIDGHSLLLDAALLVFVVPGAFIGKWAVNRINQQLFDRLVVAATVVGALELLLS